MTPWIVERVEGWHDRCGGIIPSARQDIMARSIEQERNQLLADEQRLAERRKQHDERVRTELMKDIEKSGLLKAEPEQFKRSEEHTSELQSQR